MELEEMRRKYQVLEKEKDDWKQKVQDINARMDIVMDTMTKQYTEKMEKEMQLMKQTLKDEAREENRSFKVQIQKLEGMNIAI